MKGLLTPTAYLEPRVRTFLNLQKDFPNGLARILSSIREENYLPVGNTDIDRIAKGINASKHDHDS